MLPAANATDCSFESDRVPHMTPGAKTMVVRGRQLKS
jgi:hypothetical protein